MLYSVFINSWIKISTSFVTLSFSETRTGNTLYQELSFQDCDAIGDVDEGADISDNESELADSKDRGFDNAGRADMQPSKVKIG